MSSNNKRSRLKALFTITGGCSGCSSSSSSSRQTSATPHPTRLKPRPKLDGEEFYPDHSHAFKTSSSVIGSSVAVEKDSDDPYNDFRQSMLQMIFEKEMYSRDDLQELLNCFLKMNSIEHHDVIVRAFTEIMSHDGPICIGSKQISRKP